MIYSLRFRNASAAPAQSVVLVMPVPPEITYVEGSVAGEGSSVTFSTDDGATYLARGRLTVTEDGAERPANNADITHIKWMLSAPLAPAKEGEVSFRGVLK